MKGWKFLGGIEKEISAGKIYERNKFGLKALFINTETLIFNTEHKISMLNSEC